MTRRIVIGVMGGGSVPPDVEKDAFLLGQLIAENGWVLLNGGRNAGVMAVTAMGARSAGGLTIGVLPGETRDHLAEGVDVAIVTGMGNARNCINVLSSDVVVACPGGTGTLSEIALAIKSNRPVILFRRNDPPGLFDMSAGGRVIRCDSAKAVVGAIRSML